jgi:RNA polymerase sigma-70 factor (ECF subfamily)
LKAVAETCFIAPEREIMPSAAQPQTTAELDRERFADLMEAVAARQDRAAFAELFGYFGPRVKSYILRLGSPDAQADEIAQDVMVTVWRKAALFDRTQASVSTWIFRIARNRRIDVFRRTERPAFDEDEPLIQPSAPPAPDEALDASEREAAVRAALEELPAEQSDLLRAAYYEGLSHSEIVERTGLPLGTVKSRIRLAFEKMRKKLGDLG